MKGCHLAFFLTIVTGKFNNIGQKSVMAEVVEIMKTFCATNEPNSIYIELFSSPYVVSFIFLIDITVYKQTVHRIFAVC